MNTLDDCFLSSIRIDPLKRSLVANNPDLTLLSTGIAAIGRGDVKLLDVVSDGISTMLMFSTSEGIPIIKVRVLTAPSPEEAKNRIRVWCSPYGHGNINKEVVRSESARYILMQLGKVRTSNVVRQRNRTRDIQNLGLSVADLVAEARRAVMGQLTESFTFTLRNERFSVTTPNRLVGGSMSDHAVYSLLRVFTGEKSMTEITNTQVQQEIAEKCAKINNTLAVHRKKWQEFREFWSKPKIAVATLPYGRGVVVGRTSFKAVADQAVEMIEDWVDPQFRNLIPASFQLKYYDSVEHIEEPVLTEIKGKCGFVRMFSKVAFPWPEAFTLADPERVLPFSRGDQILDDANFLVYAALNSDDKYMNWFVMDDDTGEAA